MQGGRLPGNGRTRDSGGKVAVAGGVWLPVKGVVNVLLSARMWRESLVAS